MTIFRNVLLAVCAGLPLAAMAAPVASNPADQAATVPPVVYQSAVATYHGAPEQDKSPDETWRAANQAVGKAASQPGKVDPMQHMSMKGMKGMNGMPDMGDDAKETKAPKDPKEPKDPAAADPHQGHDMGQMHDMKQMQHGQ